MEGDSGVCGANLETSKCHSRISRSRRPIQFSSGESFPIVLDDLEIFVESVINAVEKFGTGGLGSARAVADKARAGDIHREESDSVVRLLPSDDTVGLFARGRHPARRVRQCRPKGAVGLALPRFLRTCSCIAPTRVTLCRL